ncbi:hypothetical protein ACQP2Y_13655 [Actinoplanes sp. CA-051413]|uniref:hypothetical protein n=1 Tax=Actinoplanes sp. CA-051413 TaxID=3239899 RepID=UPI003D9959B3
MNLTVFGSSARAESYLEATDVENDEYVSFGADGTSITPSVRDGRVALTPTVEKQPVELGGSTAEQRESGWVAKKALLAFVDGDLRRRSGKPVVHRSAGCCRAGANHQGPVRGKRSCGGCRLPMR